MGRGNRGSRGDVELKTVQKVRLENQKLKKQIAKLRKELSRIDIDRYSNLKNMIEAQAAEDESFDSKMQLEELKEQWICHKCKEDYLRLIIVPRADGTFYMRRCISCQNKTKLKKYTPDVSGIDSNGNLIK